MKVRMTTTVAGTCQGKQTVEGAELDLPDGAAKDLCEKGYAEPVAVKPQQRAEKRPSKKTYETRSS